MTPDERAAYRPMLERFKRSPEVKDSIDALRMSYEAHRRRRNAILRRRVAILALEIIIGMAAAAIVLAVTFGFLMEHAK